MWFNNTNMRIQPVTYSNGYNQPKKFQKENRIIPPQFSGKLCPTETYGLLKPEKILCYEDFMISLHNVYKNKSLKNIVLSSISNSKNFIGRGFNADVFEIPGIKDYLIRIERRNFSPVSFIQNPIEKITQDYRVPNFGQAIITNNNGFFITKKVFGESNSFPDWSEKIKGVELGTDTITHTNAKYLLQKISVISQFPQYSFDKLAQKIQKLNRFTDCEIDILNPNNLIVDQNQKTLNIIDLWPHHSQNGSKEPFNGIDSMVNLILDPFTHHAAYSKLSIEDKKNFIKSSEDIINKVFTAGEKAGLKRTKNNAMIIYSDFDRKAKLNFALPSYNDFLNMYPNLL